MVSRVDGVNGTIALYRHPDLDLEQLIVPLDPRVDDYGRSMADVIERLSKHSGRAPLEVLNDLLIPPSDVLRFVVDEPEARSGSIPLEQSISLLTGAQRALLSSACSVIQPQSFHPRLSRAEAEQLIGACRMGQTERGSFTLTIACPVEAVDSELTLLKPTPLFDGLGEAGDDPPDVRAKDPFARRVTRLLMRSLDRIARAIDADKADTLVADSPDEPAQRDLCEALLAMQPTSERSRLTVRASWARSLPRPQPSQVPGSVQLRSDYFPVISKVATDLRPIEGPKISEFLRTRGFPDGKSRLRGPNAGGCLPLAFRPRGNDQTAGATLNAEDYHIAWEAHGIAGYVSLNGILIRGGRVHRIEQVSNLKHLAP